MRRRAAEQRDELAPLEVPSGKHALCKDVSLHFTTERG